MIEEKFDHRRFLLESVGKSEGGMAWLDGVVLVILLERIEAILSGLTSWWRWEERKFRLKLQEPKSYFAKELLTKIS
jgi:hypothetical protein